MSSNITPLRDCACVGCGRKSDHVLLRPLTKARNAYGCEDCARKFGVKRLQEDFDRQYGDRIGEKPTTRECIRGCGRHVLLRPDGSLPSFCSVCTYEWEQLQRRTRAERDRRWAQGKPTEIDVIEKMRERL